VGAKVGNVMSVQTKGRAADAAGACGGGGPPTRGAARCVACGSFLSALGLRRSNSGGAASGSSTTSARAPWQPELDESDLKSLVPNCAGPSGAGEVLAKRVQGRHLPEVVRVLPLASYRFPRPREALADGAARRAEVLTRYPRVTRLPSSHNGQSTRQCLRPPGAAW